MHARFLLWRRQPARADRSLQSRHLLRPRLVAHQCGPVHARLLLPWRHRSHPVSAGVRRVSSLSRRLSDACNALNPVFHVSCLFSLVSFAQCLLRPGSQRLDRLGAVRGGLVLQWYGRHLGDSGQRAVSRRLVLPARFGRAHHVPGRPLVRPVAVVRHFESVRGLLLSAGSDGVDRSRTVPDWHILSFRRHDGRARAVHGRVCMHCARAGCCNHDWLLARILLPDGNVGSRSAGERVSGGLILRGRQCSADAVLGRLVLQLAADYDTHRAVSRGHVVPARNGRAAAVPAPVLLPIL